jgi:hypothetical protein
MRRSGSARSRPATSSKRGSLSRRSQQAGTAFAWELGGQFLIERSTVDHPEAPDSIAVVSVVGAGDGHEYVQHYFDSRGIVRPYRMASRGGEWTFVRDRPDFTPLSFAQRFTGTFAADGERSSVAGRRRTTAAPRGSATSTGRCRCRISRPRSLEGLAKSSRKPAKRSCI